MTKVPCAVRPFVDVCVPFPSKNLSQREFVGPVIFFIRFVPGGPKNKRQRAVPPDDVEIVHREILFSPVARGSDNRLVFADHLLEIFYCFQTDVILRIPEIHKRAGISAVLRNDYFDGAIWIDVRSNGRFATSGQEQCNARCEKTQSQ